jgi:hypothetical protein
MPQIVLWNQISRRARENISRELEEFLVRVTVIGRNEKENAFKSVILYLVLGWNNGSISCAENKSTCKLAAPAY